MQFHGLSATCVAFWLFAALGQAQQSEHHQNSQSSEDALAESMLQQSFPGHLSGRGDGFTSRFDPAFNPAMGLFFDGLAHWSEDAGADVDNFDFRSVELNMASRIDPFGWAYLVAAFEEGDFSLEEAVLVMDRLPANMSLRVGKMLTDFGKWNSLHLHDKPFVFEDGVRSEFFGGNLNTTGVELHQWTGVGDLPVRWSLGMSSSFGHSAPAFGETGYVADSFQSGVIDNRGFEEMAYHGRVTAQQDSGQNGFLQYGASFFHTAEGLVSEHDHNGDGLSDDSIGLGQTTFAFDFTWRDVNASSRTADTLSVELWRNGREYADPLTDSIERRNANGVWGFFQHDFDPFWSGGAMASWWQDAANTASTDWFAASQAGSQRAVFVTRNFSEYNRMRLQLTESTPTAGSPVWSLALQWDVILGSHSHSMDW